ncbi:MAG TPA: hypothetical protein VK821_04070, partial [Dehalococcoidia bacterium]|nr:hypothetical protein [Dehalococcoidia bacterium]
MSSPYSQARRRSMQLSRRRLIGGVGIVGASATLAACGGNRTSSQKAVGSTASGKPHAGGTVAVNVETDPFDWDLSYIGKSVPNSNGTALAYEGLLTLKRGPDVKFGDLIVQPKLAEKWEAPD